MWFVCCLLAVANHRFLPPAAFTSPPFSTRPMRRPLLDWKAYMKPAREPIATAVDTAFERSSGLSAARGRQQRRVEGGGICQYAANRCVLEGVCNTRKVRTSEETHRDAGARERRPGGQVAAVEVHHCEEGRAAEVKSERQARRAAVKALGLAQRRKRSVLTQAACRLQLQRAARACTSHTCSSEAWGAVNDGEAGNVQGRHSVSPQNYCCLCCVRRGGVATGSAGWQQHRQGGLQEGPLSVAAHTRPAKGRTLSFRQRGSCGHNGAWHEDAIAQGV